MAIPLIDVQTNSGNTNWEIKVIDVDGQVWWFRKDSFVEKKMIEAIFSRAKATTVTVAAKFATTAAVLLTGLAVQGGGDWAAPLTAGDRILVKNQASQPTNGIYDAAAGAWTRSSDFDETADITSGMLVPVDQGSTLADSLWMLTTPNPIVLGTSNITFSLVGPPLGILTDNLVWVDPINGNNTTGLVGRIDKPFLTPTAAKAAATAGMTVVVLPGNYTDTALGKQNVNWFCYPGVKFIPGAAAAVFNVGTGAGQSKEVRGYAAFDITFAGSSAFNASGAAFPDVAVIEFDYINGTATNAAVVLAGSTAVRGNDIIGTGGGAVLRMEVSNGSHVVTVRSLDKLSSVATGDLDIDAQIIGTVSMDQPGGNWRISNTTIGGLFGASAVVLSFASDLNFYGCRLIASAGAANGVIQATGDANIAIARFISCRIEDLNITECIKFLAAAANKSIVLQGCHLQAQLVNSIVAAAAQNVFCEAGGSSSNKVTDINTTTVGTYNVNALFV